MPLTLILGRVGCGKIGYLADDIARYLDDNPDAPVTLLVPDQYTVASENFFLTRLGEKRSRTLSITSLKSLARTRFAAHGKAPRFLGEGGKTVLMKKAFDAVSPSLRYFPATYRNPRFLPLLLGAVKELKAAGISADELMETAKRENNDKLYDIAMIRQVYEGYLDLNYADPDDAPARLCTLLEDTGDFEGERVYAANFRSFYNRERKVLLQMVKNGAHVTVTLPTDTTDPARSPATADAAGEAQKLIAYCKRMGEECHVINLQKNASFDSEEFALLERETVLPSGETFPRAPENVHLFCGADRFDEIEQIAATIARKVREEGMRYSDFTVIVRSLEDYAGILDPVFDQYEIPLFYHRKTPLRQRNPMPLIVALFSMASEGMHRDQVLAFVKSGFCATPEDGALFERYVNVWGVNYNRFFTPFNRPMGGFTEEESPEDAELRLRAEAVRQRVTETVTQFKTRTQEATVREISLALYETLTSLGVPAQLKKNAQDYRNYKEYELAARQKKVYEQLMLSLDEMVLTAGDDPVTLKEYRDLFFAVIDTHDLAILPTSLDEVVAGSPETLPMISPRCVFAAGFNEGVFPKNVDDNRLLTDRDRQQLAQYDPGDTTEDKILHEMYYCYATLTAPREELYLSYAAVIGEESAPSAVIDSVRRIFPRLKTQRFSLSDPASLKDRIQRERAAFALHTRTPVTELGDYFAKKPAYEGLLARRQEVALSPETARRIYPDTLRISATKTNTYHQCRYAYFLNYGLGIRPTRNAGLDPLQKGTIVHEALEKFIAEGFDEEDLHDRIVAYGEDLLKRFYGDDEPPAPMKRYFDALMKKIEGLLRMFRKEFAASKFVPVAFEQGIGMGETPVPATVIPLERGSISVIGAVDRVDAYEQDGKKYLRVVDYKTGSKKFDFRHVQNGIDVQMLMYLLALRQNLYPNENCVPAGVQYVSAKTAPVAGTRDQSEEELQEAWEAATVRSGVYLKDDSILHAMDDTPDRRYLRIVKSSSPYLITEAAFGKLFEDITLLLQKMGDSLHRGAIDKNPIAIGRDYESCRFCDLKDYCRHPEPRNALIDEEVTDRAPMD